MYGLALGRAGAEQPNSIQNAALGILRRYGTNAHIYIPGSMQVSYGAELVTTQFTSLTGYINQTRCSLAIVGDEIELTATATGVCFVDVPSVAIAVGSTYQASAMARYSGSAGGVVYLGAAMASVPFSNSTASATSILLSLTPVADHTQLSLRMRLDATAIGQKAYFKLGSVRQQITTSSVTAGLPTNNYTLSDGSSGYSAVDGTAGLVLDAMGSVGAELFTGAFTRNNTVEIDTTTIPALCTSTGVFSVVGINKTATANTPYQCTLTWSGNTTGRSIQFGGGTGIATLGTAVSGSATFTVVPSIGNMYIYFSSSAAGQAVSFDSFSARPISGIHATQSTTANKPAERRGLYNLALSSQNLVNAAWVPVGDTTVAANRATFPTGGIGNPVRQNFSFTSGAPYTVALDCKAISGISTGTLDLQNGETGTFTAPASRGIVVYNVTPGAARTWLDIQLDGAGVIDVYAVGLFQGTLTAAQILSEGGIPLTTSAAASNQSAGRYWHQYTAANSQFMAIGSVPFQMSDDHCVIAGFTPNAGGVFAVGITNAGGTTMCGNLRLASDGVLSAWWKDDVAAQSLIYGSGSVIGVTLVASARKVGNVKSLRSNGTQVATDSTVLGTTTLTNANIGSLTSVAGFMNGTIGPVILIKGTVSDADLLTLERWVASQTPNGPQF